jgi:hypothetical protein
MGFLKKYFNFNVQCPVLCFFALALAPRNAQKPKTHLNPQLGMFTRQAPGGWAGLGPRGLPRTKRACAMHGGTVVDARCSMHFFRWPPRRSGLCEMSTEHDHGMAYHSQHFMCADVLMREGPHRAFEPSRPALIPLGSQPVATYT